MIEITNVIITYLRSDGTLNLSLNKLKEFRERLVGKVLVVVNNCHATDDVSKMLPKYGLPDRIDWMLRTDNYLSSARHDAILHLSKTKQWVRFIDDDDTIPLNSLKAQEAMYNSGCLGTECLNMFVAKWTYKNEVLTIPQFDHKLFDREFLYDSFSFSSWNWVAYTPWLATINYPLGVNYGEDTAFMINMYAHSKYPKFFLVTLYEYVTKGDGMASNPNRDLQSVLDYLKISLKGLEVEMFYVLNPDTNEFQALYDLELYHYHPNDINPVRSKDGVFYTIAREEDILRYHNAHRAKELMSKWEYDSRVLGLPQFDGYITIPTSL